MDIKFIRRAEYQHGQEYVKQGVGVDVSCLVDSPFEQSLLGEQSFAEECADKQSEAEKTDGIGESGFLEYQFQKGSDQKCSEDKEQGSQSILIFHLQFCCYRIVKVSNL